MTTSLEPPADNDRSPAVTAFELGMDAQTSLAQQRARLAVVALTGQPFVQAPRPSLTTRIKAAVTEFRHPRAQFRAGMRLGYGLALDEQTTGRIRQAAGV